MKMKKEKTTIKSINFHLWKACNFKCKYCFATYNDSIDLYKIKKNLDKQEMFKIVKEIADYGIEKISFAGGEPFLCNWLDELVVYSKSLGLTTMVITNGYKLDEKFLQKVENSLDWLTISIDSLKSEQLLKIGRSNGRKTMTKKDYLEKIALLKKYNVKFKMNTVVNTFNYNEDFTDFIKITTPLRWKVFQVLPISGQRETIKELFVGQKEFMSFVKKHEKNGIEIIAENNDAMLNSYLMIDPLGRLYDNSKLKLNYSKPVLEIGLDKAIEQIVVSDSKFIKRKGNYNWK